MGLLFGGSVHSEVLQAEVIVRFAKGSTMYPPVSTPWGPVQTRREVAAGIWSVSTAGHGGFWLAPERFAEMPASCKATPYSAGGFYEEDCDCLLVLARFPEALETVSMGTVHKWLLAQRSYFTDQRLNDLGVQVPA